MMDFKGNRLTALQTESELEAARKTIETLHQQLMELEKSESLSRAREQHESVVMATRKRYEEEVVRLKQKLDDVNNSLLWKVREVRVDVMMYGAFRRISCLDINCLLV